MQAIRGMSHVKRQSASRPAKGRARRLPRDVRGVSRGLLRRIWAAVDSTEALTPTLSIVRELGEGEQALFKPALRDLLRASSQLGGALEEILGGDA